jgi:hypothetical protein
MNAPMAHKNPKKGRALYIILPSEIEGLGAHARSIKVRL